MDSYFLKNKLCKEVYKVTDFATTNSPNYRQIRKTTLIQIVSESLDIKLGLNSFYDFTIDHFNSLLLHWKQQGIANSTIVNKIAALKWYLKQLGISVSIPKSKELGLSKNDLVRKYSVVTEDLKHKVYNPISRTILDFQLYFGLTANESIKLPYPSNNEIYIDSKISHNKFSRFITVINDKQREAIKYRQELLGNKKSLLDFGRRENLLKMYQVELELAGINSYTDIRKFYIQQRLVFLEKCKFSEKEAYYYIMKETGFTKKQAFQKLAFNK